MRIRTVLSLAASAAAVLTLAAPAQAADNGDYYVRDARSGACLTAGEGPVGGDLRPCGPDTVWSLRNEPDRSVRFQDKRDPRRCLALSPVPLFPPPVFAGPCGESPDRWRIEGEDDNRPVALRLAEDPGLGSLTARGPRATLAGHGEPEWLLQRLG
ncbi:hypothetical protein ACFVT5_38940 [Streptomyces sp. NPDC058001]|uniref:hypothetical protein n=1 Tax=Streptomyces sp. NPDC058001 TaxID=3346300 RepID=UPI0036EAD955